jgi:hypothetical protein
MIHLLSVVVAWPRLMFAGQNSRVEPYLWHNGTDTENSAKCLSDADQFDSRMNMYVNLPPQNSTPSSQLESSEAADEMHSAYSELCQFSPA